MKLRWFALSAVVSLTLALSPISSAFDAHPEIRSALNALETAQDHLQHAAHDFGGHRVDAMKAISEAERQLQICEQYDRH